MTLRRAPLAALSLLFSTSVLAVDRGETPHSLPVTPDAAARAWVAATGDRDAAERLPRALRLLAGELAAAGRVGDAPGLAAPLLQGVLASHGADADAIARLLPDLVQLLDAETTRLAGGAPSGPLVPVRVGPLELTRGDAVRVVGPRAGRSRTAVLARLRDLPGDAGAIACASTDAQLLALVPELVAIATPDMVLPDGLELRFRAALGEPEPAQ